MWFWYNIYTGYIKYTTYDSSPPSCGLLVKISNTSLRIKDECLIFTTTKICSNVNKLTKQKKSKLKPFPLLKSETSVEPHMSHVNSLYLVFYISREGGWEFHPF